MKERDPKLTEAEVRLYAGERAFMATIMNEGGEFEIPRISRGEGLSREFVPKRPAREPAKMDETVRNLFASPALAGSSEERRELASSFFELTNPKPLKEWEDREYGEALSVLPGESQLAIDLRQKLLGLSREYDKAPQELGESEAEEERGAKKSEGLDGFTKKIRSNLAELDKEALTDKRKTWRAYEDKAEESGDKEGATAAAHVVKMVQEAQELQEIAGSLHKTENAELQDYARGFVERFKRGDELSKEELLDEYEKLMLLKTRLQIGEKGDEYIAGYTRPLLSVLSSRLEERGVANDEIMQERADRVREAGYGDHPQNQSLGADRREDESPLAKINLEDFPLGEEGEPEELQEWKRRRRNFIIQAQDMAKSGNPEGLQALWGSQMDSFMSMGSDADQAVIGAVMEELRSYRDREAEHAAAHSPYKEGDEGLYVGSISETLEERMERILDPDPKYDEERLKYYNDIYMWVGRVLKNDSREVDGGQLRLKEERYKLFKKIMGQDTSKLTTDELRENVIKLRDEEQGNLLNYFRQKDGTEINRSASLKKERGRGSDLPQSLEETMTLLVEQYGGDWNGELDPGGEYQLIDLEGNFHIENFMFWVRQKVNDMAAENPKQEIKPMREISLRTTYSQVTLDDILYTPQYRNYMPFIVAGDETKSEEEGGNEVEAYWGQPVEHEDFDKPKARSAAYEINFYGRAHSEAGTSSTNRGEEKGYMDASMQMHGDSSTSRGLWGIWFQAPSRGEGTAKEFKEGGDGTMGRAVREMVVGYTYLTEFTEFYKKDGATAGPIKRFEDNMFYKFLEPNGSNAFLMGLAEGALDKNKDVKKIYNGFVEERMRAAADEYLRGADLSEEDRRAINDTYESFRKAIESKNPPVQFDRCFYREEGSTKPIHFLRDFHVRIQEAVLRKGKLNAEARNEIDKKVRDDLLGHLKEDFFAKVKDVIVSGQRLGDIEFGVELDSTGIAVDDKTGKRELKNNTQKMALGQLLDDFATGLVENYDQFIDYDRDKKDDEKADPQEIIRKDGFVDFFKRNERLALALSDMVAGKKRIDINQFRDPTYGPSQKTFLDTALEKGIAKTAFGLHDVEADYAWAWAKNMLTSYDIADLNDTTGTGFGYGARLLQSQRHLARQLDRVNPVSKAAIEELGALMLPMTQMLRVKMPDKDKVDRTFHDVLQGGKGMDIKSRRERVLASAGLYEMGENDELNMVINPRRNASAFLEMIKKGGFDMGDVSTTDIYGNVIMNPEKAAQAFTTAWKIIRYTYNQASTDYSEKIVRNGKEIQLLELYLGKKSRTVLAEVQRQVKPYDAGWAFKNPAMGVYAALVGAEIASHRDHSLPKKYWTIQQITELERVMAHAFSQHELVGGDEKTLQKIGTLIGPKVFDVMLGVNGESYAKMYNSEFFWAFLTGVLLGFKEGFNEMAPHLLPKE